MESSECSVGQEQQGNMVIFIIGCGSSEPPYHDSF